MADNKVSIKQFMKDECLQESLMVIKDSFITVAKEFNFTEEKCPSNPDSQFVLWKR
ncbi:hypothetical protein [Desulfosporosinus sp.]|uniref:hypothetical protein n=1 Tax=Desulfosporosinus sp. TaxID=157907 RepID=UPI002619281B|nr:hypothetical protein [Desulfosporosinus sp.]MCO5386591.1 hypothetical protein [Desulfosporosinus sp.]